MAIRNERQLPLLARGDPDDPFVDEYEFLDDVHGPIRLNRLERDAIDTPEYQRLFRLGQLGFVDLVYPTANHTRGTHSIGVCHWTKKLIDTLTRNCSRTLESSRAERILISLGGLLHDVPHGPYSHDIEKKTHHIYPKGPASKQRIFSYYGPYEKHDNWKNNPALYVFLNDTTTSVMARVLRHYSASFAKLLLADADQHSHLRPFVDLLNKNEWPDFERELLPKLLFHLLVYEKPEEAKECPLELLTSFGGKEQEWGLGPRANWKKLHIAWYQPFRHDIIGDTLSADLIDYLIRDQARLGIKNERICLPA
jgi:HD superfamily phosphohydrolase